MRIGVCGGSFNPIHAGHVESAAEAATDLDLDQVLFVPTAVPPHKNAGDLADPWRRFAMVELALLDEDWGHASARELGRQTSYSIDTLEALSSEHPDTEFVLLIGGDSLAQLTTWKRWRDLLAWEIGVLRRPCAGCPEPGTIPDELEAGDDARIRWVGNRLHPASASTIRAQLAAGERPADLNPRVLDYVLKYSLYR